MRRSPYGGQALIEGLMIKGPQGAAIAVRRPDGGIELKQVHFKKGRSLAALPVVRGAVEFFRMTVQGMKALFYSAQFMEEDETPSALEIKLRARFGDRGVDKLILYVAAVISVAFSVGLFMLLPNFLAGIVAGQNAALGGLIEGCTRIALFTGYLALTSRLAEMQRIWMYHGAEHKAIHCYEHERPLTVENVRAYPTAHNRCGTAFLVLVIVISVLLFSLTGWHGIWVNLGIRLLMLPIVAGVSYELFRFLWRYDNALVRAVMAPGMLFQRFTTREPDDDQIEVAIAAFEAALHVDTPEVW